MSIIHKKQFISQEISNFLFNYIKTNSKWQKFPYSPNSRVVTMYSDDVIPTELLNIIEMIEIEYHVILRRYAFINNYENGERYCPYHSDEYGCDTFTLSLGETRDFLVKQNGKGTKSQKFTLESGDLVYMDLELQKTHKHSVPKRKNSTNQRISILLFVERNIV